MARRPQRIYHLKADEKALVQGLWRVGVFTEKDARKYFDITDKRYNLMLKDGYLIQNGDQIRIGAKAVKHCEDRFGMKHQYRSSPQHIKHDLKLSKTYLHLSPEYRETWMTESQIAVELKGKAEFQALKEQNWPRNSRNNFIPDAAVYSPSHGGYVAIESITESYSKQDIAQKTICANTFFKGMLRV